MNLLRFLHRGGLPVLCFVLTLGSAARSGTADPSVLLPKPVVVTSEAPLVLQPPAPDGVWDFSTKAILTVTVRSTSQERITVQVRAENAGADGMKDAVQTSATLPPGKALQTVTLRLVRRPQDPTYGPFSPYYMYFKNINVRDNTIDPSAVSRVAISVTGAAMVTDVRARGTGTPGPVPFYPFVDEYGQYAHSDWPGKIYRDSDFADRVKEEDAEMRSYPGPADWDKWGGWSAGPKQAATGYFYPEKYQGKWWLVDPDGRLYYSYGPTGVGFGEGSPVTGRENWFAWLPPHQNNAFAKYWGQGQNAKYMYYQNKSYQSFDFSGADAERKYGPDWRVSTLDRLHRRLRNWGFNTVANWSSPEVMARRKTPYCVAIQYGGPSLDRIPDAFSPVFEQALRERMQREKGVSAGDPWCIGYFVDNELWWGPGQRGEAVAHGTLQAAPDSASKLVFVADLTAKYGDIAKLNAAWGTAYASWDTLRDSRTLPADMKKPAVAEDCGVFGLKFADRYFSTVRRIVKEVAPNNLYLGCRFNGNIDTPLVQAAARYCDVISYNVYDPRPGDRLNRYIGAVDKPFIVGEFGVVGDPLETPFRGATYSEDANIRTARLETYIRAAFEHPLMVGAHFFQFRDQPLTGRGDGEATLRGVVDIADTPHFDLVQANRHVAYQMYAIRAGQEKK